MEILGLTCMNCGNTGRELHTEVTTESVVRHTDKMKQQFGIIMQEYLSILKVSFYLGD